MNMGLRMIFTLVSLVIFANIASAKITLIRSTATTIEWNLGKSLQPGKKYAVEVLLNAPTGKVRVIDEPLNSKAKTYKAFNLKSNKVYQLRLYVLGGRGEDLLSAPTYTNLKCFTCNGATSAEHCAEVQECSSNERQCFTKIRFINTKYGKRMAVYKGCKESSNVCLSNKKRIQLLKTASEEIGELTNEQILETMPGLRYFGDLDKVLARSPSILKQVKKKFAENKKKLFELELKKKCSNRDDPEDFCRCCCTAVRCNHAMLDCGITPPPDLREDEPLPPDIATTPPETTFPTRAPRKIAPVCQDYNGGCDHICIPLNKTTVRCGCHNDYKLQEDGKTCKTHLLHAVADAGPDITITFPQNSVTISGKGTQGSVKKYKWWDPIAVGSSSAPIVTGQTERDLKVSNLKAGSYKFILMVTGMDGRRTSDMMTLTVNPDPATINAPAKIREFKRHPRVRVLGQSRFQSLAYRQRWKTYVKKERVSTKTPEPTSPALKFSTTPKTKYIIFTNKPRRTRPGTTKKTTTPKPTRTPTTKKTTIATTTKRTTTKATKAQITKPKHPNQKHKGGGGKKLHQKGKTGKVTGGKGGKAGKGGKGGKRVAKPKSVKRKGHGRPPAQLRMANAKPVRKMPPKKTGSKPASKKTKNSPKKPKKSGHTKRKTLNKPFIRKPVTSKKQTKKQTKKHSNPKPSKLATERIRPKQKPKKTTPRGSNFKQTEPKKPSPEIDIPNPKSTKDSIFTTMAAPITITVATETSTDITTTRDLVTCPALDSLSERDVEADCSDSNLRSSQCTFSCKGPKTLQGGADSVTCGAFGGKSTWMNGPAPAVLPCCESSCPANAHSDIIFMIHSTTKVGKSDWTKIVNFVYSIISKYTLGKDNVCVGAIRFNSRVDVKSEVPLDCSRSKFMFKRALLKMPFAGYGSNAGTALRHLMTKSFKSKNNRPRAQDVAVIITDAKSTDDVIKPSKQLKSSGVKVQVIGIKTKAGAANPFQLKSMASVPGKIINFQKIPTVVIPALDAQFKNLVCVKGCQRYEEKDIEPLALLKKSG